MSRQCVILAGGAGRRLRARLGDLAKPMIPVGGKPLLDHQLELVRRYGFTEVVLLVHYRAEIIAQHVGNGERWGLRVQVVTEPRPLGTAGAVLAALDQLADQFLVLYGDTMVNVDLDRLWQAHHRSGAAATLLLHPNDHPWDSDLVEIDSGGRIVAFHNRPHPEGVWRQNLVNAGLYVLSKAALMAVPQPPRQADRTEGLDFGRDLFPALLRAGVRLQGYLSPEYIKDIGTPERYDRVCAEYAAGVVARSSLAVPQPAVFLDRDGTLVEEVGGHGISSPEQLRLLPGAAEAISQLNHAGLRAVLVSNQAVVAKGMCSEAQLRLIHNKLETLLGRQHAFLDRSYYCPHHPEKGFPGERPELKIDCTCRKPKTGLIQQAVQELNIDLGQSWLVGDSTVDVQTARNAGVRAVLVRTGYGGRDGRYPAQPDFTFDTLALAVQFILRQAGLA